MWEGSRGGGGERGKTNGSIKHASKSNIVEVLRDFPLRRERMSRAMRTSGRHNGLPRCSFFLRLKKIFHASFRRFHACLTLFQRRAPRTVPLASDHTLSAAPVGVIIGNCQLMLISTDSGTHSTVLERRIILYVVVLSLQRLFEWGGVK